MAHTLFLAAMFNTGWVVMGHSIIKPLNDKSCCPNYQIRLDTHLFEPSKSQLKLLRRRAGLLLCSPPQPGDTERMARPSSRDIDSDGVFLADSAAGGAAPAAPTPGGAAPAAPGPTPLSFQVLIWLIQAALRHAVSTNMLPACALEYAGMVEVHLPAKAAGRGVTAASNAALRLVPVTGQPAESICAALIESIRALVEDSPPSLASVLPQLVPLGVRGFLNFIVPLAVLLEHYDALQLLLAYPLPTDPAAAVAAPPSVADVASNSSESSPKLAMDTRQSIISGPPIRASGDKSLPKRQLPAKLSVQHVRASFDMEAYKLYKRFNVEVHHKNPEWITPDGYESFLCVTCLAYRPVLPAELYGAEVVPPAADVNALDRCACHLWAHIHMCTRAQAHKNARTNTHRSKHARAHSYMLTCT